MYNQRMLSFQYNKKKEREILAIQKEKNRHPESLFLLERFIEDVPISVNDPFIQKHISVF